MQTRSRSHKRSSLKYSNLKIKKNINKNYNKKSKETSCTKDTKTSICR